MCIIKQGVTKSSNRAMHVSCLQFYYSQIYKNYYERTVITDGIL